MSDVLCDKKMRYVNTSLEVVQLTREVLVTSMGVFSLYIFPSKTENFLDKMSIKFARWAYIVAQIVQVIFTYLKLWVAVARPNFKAAEGNASLKQLGVIIQHSR